MQPRLRVAILECDNPHEKVRAKYGNYGDIFEKLLNDGADKIPYKDGAQRPRLSITKYNVVNEELYPELEDVDAVLLTGSKYNSFDNDPWILKLVDFTKRVLQQDRVRLIGVCFGHQIIGRAMDAKVARSDRGWEIAVVPVTLTPKGREVFQMDHMTIQQMHRDVVYDCPPSAERLGFSDRCDVQGMYIKNRLITVQGHPEFNAEIESILIENRHDMGIFDDALYKDGMSRVDQHHDGNAIGATFVRFLLDS